MKMLNFVNRNDIRSTASAIGAHHPSFVYSPCEPVVLQHADAMRAVRHEHRAVRS